MSSRKNHPRGGEDECSSSSSSDDDDDEHIDFLNDDSDSDDDDEEPEESLSFRPVCAPSDEFPTLREALDSDLSVGFDLVGLLLLLCPPGGGAAGGNGSDSDDDDDDDLLENAILLINLCRSFVAASHDDSSSAASSTSGGRKGLGGEALTAHVKGEISTAKARGGGLDEKYYRPLLEDDALLMCVGELEELARERRRRRRTRGGGDADEAAAQQMAKLEISGGGGDTAAAASPSPSSQTELRLLKSRVASLEEQLAKAKACIASLASEDDDSSRPSSSIGTEQNKKPDNDTYYFSSYSATHIHRSMLSDEVRTSSYERAILDNPSLFEDKVVLDVGCGTGVLSIFAARAGARKVVAVDNSDVAEEAAEIVKLNGYGNVIHVVRGKLEELMEGKGGSHKNEGLPLDDGEKFDVIVSEWMGYALFFETMLPSVVLARDQLMVPPEKGGTMYPNRSSVYLEAASDGNRTVTNYWENVHGIDMTPMKVRAIRELTEDENGADVEVVPDEHVVTNRVKLVEHDLNVCRDEELDFESTFVLTPRDHGASANENGTVVAVAKLVVSFDIDFDLTDRVDHNGAAQHNPISFSTGCQSEPTHWKQTVLWFDPREGKLLGKKDDDGNKKSSSSSTGDADDGEAMEGDGFPTLRRGEVMRGTFRMGRNKKNPREMDFHVQWEVGRRSAAAGDDDDDADADAGGEGGFVRRLGGSLQTKLGA